MELETGERVLGNASVKNDCRASGFVRAIIYSCVKIFWHGAVISEPLEAVACIKNITKTSHLNTHTYRKPYPGETRNSSKRTRPAACDSALGSWGWEPPAQFIVSSFEALSATYEPSTQEAWLEAVGMAPRAEKSPPSVKGHS